MPTIICTLLSFLTIACCSGPEHKFQLRSGTAEPPNYTTIENIPTPKGYARIPVEENAMGDWLRKTRLKKDGRVYLYDGRVKNNQTAQFAVLDIPVGSKDLQQCADAILRLKAEYLFSRYLIDSIHFKATDGTDLSFARWLKGERYKLIGGRLLPYTTHRSLNNQRVQLDEFLEVVFSYCGTYSLRKETRSVKDLAEIAIGDIFIRAGSPGHAIVVVDVAVNQQGEKIFMLAQSYMPAQDIHIIKNPMDEPINPWYRANAGRRLVTPEWVFNWNQLRRWY
jgi:Domain of unknown function (4846)